MIDSMVGAGFGLIASAFFVFMNIGIAGIGAPSLPYMLMFSLFVLALAYSAFSISLDKRSIITFLAFVFFSFSYFISFYINGSTTPKDNYFVVQMFANVAFLFYSMVLSRAHPRLMYKFLVWLAIGMSFIIIVMWLKLVVSSHDLFVMRDNMPQGQIYLDSVFYNPNALARVCVMIIGILYIGYLNTIYHFFYRKLYLLLLIIISLITICTLSRANIVALMIFLYAYLVYRNKGPVWNSAAIIKYGILLVALVVVGLLFSDEVRQRLYSLYVFMGKIPHLESEAGVFLPPRLRSWLGTYDIIVHHPYFGVGLSHVHEYLNKYGSVHYHYNGETVIAVHGGFLKIAAYGGLFTLVSFLIAYYMLYRQSKKYSIDYRYTYRGHFAYALRVLLILIFLGNIAADSFGLSITWMIIGVIYGLMSSDSYRNSMAMNNAR